MEFGVDHTTVLEWFKTAALLSDYESALLAFAIFNGLSD